MSRRVRYTGDRPTKRGPSSRVACLLNYVAAVSWRIISKMSFRQPTRWMISSGSSYPMIDSIVAIMCTASSDVTISSYSNRFLIQLITDIKDLTTDGYSVGCGNQVSILPSTARFALPKRRSLLSNFGRL